MVENEFAKRYLKLKEITESDSFDNFSLNELYNLLEEAKGAQNEYENLQLVVKRDANSLYGTTGSAFFSLGDYDSAEDITQTGKHYAVIVDIAINNFFVNWDNEELKIIQQFYPDVTKLKKFDVYQIDTVNDICVYGDTDSRYIDLSKIYELIGKEVPPNTPEGNKELSDFGLFLMNNFLNKLIKETIENDVNYRNAVPGHLKMAHEITTRRCIFQKKKKYVMNSIWKDGKLLSKNKITYKGVEIKKGELNSNIKKIIQILLEKFIEEKITEEDVRFELIKLIKYIKKLNKKSYIYKISAVSGLDNIYFDEVQNKYVSEKKHIQIQIACFWYNFIHENKLNNEYKLPFEKQKMYFYYSKDNLGNKFVVGCPDDVDIDTIKNLPEPDWNLMFNEILIKPILRYIKNYNDNVKIDDKICTNFLLGIKEYDI